MEPLRGRIRDYAWGSRTVIAELQGRPVPSPGPEAELWLGAHPDSPAALPRDSGEVNLADLLAAEPDRWLSASLLDRFGPRLPYLMKVLAAEAPLSLQVHPDAEQARQGYAAQTAELAAASSRSRPQRDRAAGAPEGGDRAGDAARPDDVDRARPAVPRNYADPYHKPELLVALTPFDALCGFRDPRASAEVLAAFGVPELAPVTESLRAGADGLPAAVRTLLTWPESERAALVAAVVAAEVAPGFAADAALARRLADRYPADPGVLVALLLNRVTLAPGEAIWMPAGNLHAYLSGAGVEIMAASDNVLRGGLTAKHVDVPELLRILRFEVLVDPIRPAVPVAPGVVTWPVPVDDFALHAVRLDADLPRTGLAPSGPRILLCVTGQVEAADRRGAVTLRRGDAAIGPADGGELVLHGVGEVFVASTGVAQPARTAEPA